MRWEMRGEMRGEMREVDGMMDGDEMGCSCPARAGLQVPNGASGRGGRACPVLSWSGLAGLAWGGISRFHLV